MKQFLLPLLISFALISESQAQFTRYIVKLKNKGGASYAISNPLVYLSQRAVDRRLRYSIPIDSADLPVTPSYITQIDNVPNVTILNVSKWMNAVTIQTSDAAAITTISGLPFVQSVNGLAARINGRETPVPSKFDQENIIGPQPFVERIDRVAADYFNYGTNSYNEIHLHNGEFLHNIGLRGQDMQIGMLDNGFNNYLVLKSFDSARINGQILGTWDFVAREANVTNDGSHGMQCFSTIVANIPGQFIGKAPKASFWLYRTEDDASETPIEEFNWVCGAERADSTGSDVISSSLGYNVFDNPSLNYTYNDMNGNTTISAKGADMAAKKGLLVFNAAGNEGNSAWHYIITPADGDSVVAVGAVNTAGVIGSFSSYGPSSDAQIKPDMSSVGVAALVQTTANTVGTNNGTSFACPNMAGLGTCLWQGFPEYNNMKILRALQLAGHKAATPDDRVGYGIPNMKTAFSILLTEYATSSSTAAGCRITINWTSKDVGAMKYEIERKAPGEPGFTKVGELNPLPGILLVPHSYLFNNDLISGSTGLYTYRIRQVIDTVTASFTAIYIDTTTITISSPCVVTGIPTPDPNKERIVLQPNPIAGSTVTLVIETPYAITNMPIAVYDSKGGMVLQLQETKGTGRKTIDLPVGRLAAGKYYVSVFNGQRTIGTVELIKL